MTNAREIKLELYVQLARIAKVLGNPKRLELLDLLLQVSKPVEMLAHEANISVKLASAHLKELRVARLVNSERRGKQVIYRLASAEVPRFLNLMRDFAQDRLFELQDALQHLSQLEGESYTEDQHTLLEKAKAGEMIILDVRPENEFDHAHFPFAKSIPLTELKKRLHELPANVPVTVYCRGPYCIMTADAIQILKQQGYTALALKTNVTDWAEMQDK
ncbi:ArsR/SmtB family transcription factor [Acinetobacter brisouii]|jgi:rhodanese-related sulfurtransferase